MPPPLYPTFLQIAKHLNESLGIVPVLYGSLGLGLLIERDLESQDIDILVPRRFITTEWHKLVDSLAEIGFEMVDEREHEFVGNGVKVGIAYEEDLEPFAGVDYKELEVATDDGAKYKILTLENYKKVYSESKLDSYRANKKNKQDAEKIEFINNYLNQKRRP